MIKDALSAYFLFVLSFSLIFVFGNALKYASPPDWLIGLLALMYLAEINIASYIWLVETVLG